MDTPLGRTAGHTLEVRESVEVLAGGGPADVVMLARKMLAAAKLDAGKDPADAFATAPRWTCGGG
jgi:thymidine phosphorylase